ncbi:MAG: sugar phosphate isomerase/epimerase [Acidobacteria bacterium]|nr:sugar phosphate isomerase/epimerase [Acidobacteriota bacterium]
MRSGFSTYVFLQHRLHPGLLEALHRSGAETIEVAAARHHFDYTDRSAVREIAEWFRSNPVKATLHQPLYADAQWSRHVAPTLNVIDVEKSRRIDAMDEVKRALEAAEQVPFAAIVLHLGVREDTWSQRSLEHSLTAIEHLKAFAHPMGVKVLLENLHNEIATPEHLLEILKVGHFDTVGICLDLGHAHLSDLAIAESFALLKPRIAEIHWHDNHGVRDEHLWPGEGDIDWPATAALLRELPTSTPAILEIGHELEETTESIAPKAGRAFELLHAQSANQTNL